MKKLWSSVLVIFSMFLLVSSAQAASDLPSSHSFHEEMTYLLDEGIITGYPDGTVRPESTVTRAEAAIMVGRLKGLDGTQQATPFSDVTARQKASGFIAAAAEAGLIDGYPDGTFKPYAPITRGDMAIILSRSFDLGFSFNSDFTDVSPNMELYDAVGKMVAASIAVGYDDHTFRPNEPITRGQFSAFVARGLEPQFKNDARIAGSYMKDKTKMYTYRRVDGHVEVHSYEDLPSRDGLAYGYMWRVESGKHDYDLEYQEVETHRVFLNGYPYSEYDTVLTYPVEVGKTFETGLGEPTYLTISAVNQTVETEYGTFTNATEITVANGYRYYMVEGFSTVKSLNEQGETVFELIGVE
ncbi:S-layer homology domain-containing protein [Planococcus salinus]|uniref:S-layer homology domain-containing protein n=1 Tax=Planococcus salinus TaxID=1848460 RepID=A0A3M8P7J1_9BACL|nr:S-layer homology domain-containing protein [Planococcus salinus]RNF39645.1 S-layer homology domain-containing protein [Planococcus salinus]